MRVPPPSSPHTKLGLKKIHHKKHPDLVMGPQDFPVGGGHTPLWEGHRCQQQPPVIAGTGNTLPHFQHVQGRSGLPLWKLLPVFPTENGEIQRKKSLAGGCLPGKVCDRTWIIWIQFVPQETKAQAPDNTTTRSVILGKPQKPLLGLSFAPIKTKTQLFLSSLKPSNLMIHWSLRNAKVLPQHNVVCMCVQGNRKNLGQI